MAEEASKVPAAAAAAPAPTWLGDPNLKTFCVELSREDGRSYSSYVENSRIYVKLPNEEAFYENLEYFYETLPPNNTYHSFETFKEIIEDVFPVECGSWIYNNYGHQE